MARAGAVLYWTLVVALVALGALAVFSFGFPLIALGFVLAAVYPLRRRAHLFWPPIVAVIAFWAGWWLIGPVSCRSVARPVEVPLERPASAAAARGAEGTTTCTSVLGISYMGDPYWIGPLAGIVSAAALGGGTHLLLRRRASAGD